MSVNPYLIGAAVVLAAYFAGRYSAPERVKVETVTVTKEVKVQDESKLINQVQRVIETTRKDGRPIKTTITKTVEASERKTSQETESASKERKEIENRRGLTVSALVGEPLTEVARGPVYGASLTKPFIGPITLGIWGLSSLTFGLSVGLEL